MRPLLGSIEIVKTTAVRYTPDLDLQPRQTVGDLANMALESTGNGSGAAGPVGGAQRLRQPGRAGRQNRVGRARLGTFHQPAEKFGGDFGHVARQDEVPLGPRDVER